jgi:hypothetical protein
VGFDDVAKAEEKDLFGFLEAGGEIRGCFDGVFVEPLE